MTNRRWLFLLKLCASVTLIARGWLTWQADSPIRSLFWQEAWWGDRVDDWSVFAKTSDPWITTVLAVVGIVMILCGLVPWLVERFRWTRWLLWPATGLLVIDSIARWVGTDYDLGMAIEHSLQMLAPVALYRAVTWPDRMEIWERIVLVATALTFTGHGLYAMGVHPVPLNYQTMTISILGVTPTTALTLLSVAGWLDFAAAALLFIRPLRRYALGYMILWGGLTALARIVANGHFDPWFFEVLVRTSHWLLPLLLLWSLHQRSQAATSRSEETTSSSTGQYSSPM